MLPASHSDHIFTTRLTDLNDDCLIAILERLPPHHLGAIASTSTRLQSIAQYVFECNELHGHFDMSLMRRAFGVSAIAATARHFHHFGHLITEIILFDTSTGDTRLPPSILHDILTRSRCTLRTLHAKDITLCPMIRAPPRPIFPHLCDLKLDGCSFASNFSLAAFLRHLPAPGALTSLTVGKRIDIDNAAIRELSNCRGLRRLSFTALDEFDVNCLRLHRLEMVEELNVTCTRFIPKIPHLLEYLGSARTVRQLSLDRCKLTNQLANAICRYTRIERLEFGFISDLFGSRFDALNNLAHVTEFTVRRWGDLNFAVLLRIIRKMIRLKVFRLEAVDNKLNVDMFVDVAEIFRQRRTCLRFYCCYEKVVADSQVTPEVILANGSYVQLIDTGGH